MAKLKLDIQPYKLQGGSRKFSEGGQAIWGQITSSFFDKVGAKISCVNLDSLENFL